MPSPVITPGGERGGARSFFWSKRSQYFLGRFIGIFVCSLFAASSSRGPCRPFFHVTLPARDLSAHRFNLISAPRGPAAQMRYSILPTTRRFPVRILGRVPGRSTELYPPILVGPSSVAALPPLLESIFYISISRNRSWTSFLSLLCLIPRPSGGRSVICRRFRLRW